MSVRMRAVPAAISLGALLAVGTLAACSPESIIENAIEDQTGVKVDEDDGTVTFTDDEGNTSTFTEDEGDGDWVTITSDDGSVYTQGEGIPEDFPGDVPLIDMPVVFGVSSLGADGSQVFMLTMESDVSCDGVLDDAVSELTGGGYAGDDDTTVMESSDGYWAFGTFTGAYTVTLSVASDGETGCAVTYNVESIQES